MKTATYQNLIQYKWPKVIKISQLAEIKVGAFGKKAHQAAAIGPQKARIIKITYRGWKKRNRGKV